MAGAVLGLVASATVWGGAKPSSTLKLAAEVCEPGGRLEATVQLESGVQRPKTLAWRVWDSWGRVVDQGEATLAAGAREARLAASLERFVGVAGALEVDVILDGSVAGRLRQPFKVRSERRDAYMFLVSRRTGPLWCFETLDRRRPARLAGGAARPGDEPPPDLLSVYAGGEGSQEKPASPEGDGEWRLPVRAPCFHDVGAARQAESRAGEAVRREGMSEGIRAYGAGDALALGRAASAVCGCPATKAAFAAWLAEQYGQPAALNREWGTNFARWEDAAPVGLDEARARGRLGPWCDYRAFTDASLGDFLVRVARSVRAADPDARMAVAGGEGERADDVDWFRVMKAAGAALAPPDSLVADWQRSWQGDAVLVTSLARTPLGPDELALGMWRGLLHGRRGVAVAGDAWAVTSDGVLSPAGREVERHAEAFRGGLAELLSGARALEGQVAVHYSRASFHAACAAGDRDFHLARLAQWRRLLRGAGLQPLWLSREQIEAGALGGGGIKVLVLPHSTALSPAEAVSIRRFVREGGALVGDLETGMMNHHGRASSDGVLDDVFGISREEKRGREAAPGRLRTGSAAGGWKLPDVAVEGRFLYERGVRPATAATLGSLEAEGGVSPVLLFHRLGRGAAVYWNAWREVPAAGEVQGGEQRIVDAVLAALGARAPVRVVSETGKANDFEVVAYADGADMYVGLLYRLSRGPDRVRVVLPREFWAYDVRSGKALGRRREIGPIELTEPAGAMLFGLLAARRGPPDVASTPRLRSGGVVRYRLSPPSDAERCVYRVRVFDPTDRESTLYGGVLASRGGPVSGQFWTALNDTPGAWRIVATDVVTGESAWSETVLYGD